ncbi:Inosose dehydratase [Candidatus Calditenuaceae archaeon HR02]|nr:Inosose dehydratase [Candidatus Calditenuaceae archaeon HR02]
MKLSIERLIFIRRPVVEFLECAKALGFEGVEFAEFELQRLTKDGGFDHSTLFHAVKNQGLTVSGIYWSADFHKREERNNILYQAARLAETYRRVGCENVIIGPPGGGLSAGLSQDQVLQLLDQLVKTLAEALKVFVDNGIKPSLHNHYDTLIETQTELEYVLSRIEPELLGFCPDTAHLALAGMDPAKVIERYLDRITYAHLKDIKPFTKRAGRVEKWYELTTELGSGIIDFPRIISLLKYSGLVEWLVVEQDFSEKDPVYSARESRDYITTLIKCVKS